MPSSLLVLSGHTDTRSPPCVATILTPKLERAAGSRTFIVVATPAGLGVEPEAGGAVIGSAARPSRLVVGEKLGDQFGTLPFESLPGVLSAFIEIAVERRPGDDLAARAATIAGVDDGE